MEISAPDAVLRTTHALSDLSSSGLCEITTITVLPQTMLVLQLFGYSVDEMP